MPTPKIVTSKEYNELVKAKTKKVNKFGALSCEYMGHKMASHIEIKFAEKLEYEKLANLILDWDYGIEYSLDVNNLHICKYVLDFRVHNLDGSCSYFDTKGICKGTTLSMFRIKRKLMKAVYGIEVQEAIFDYDKQSWKYK